jgi:8-oxo-dGTP pyrophosphatase MutT (NUDIX family)
MMPAQSAHIAGELYERNNQLVKNTLKENEISERLQRAYHSEAIAANDGDAEWLQNGDLHFAAVLIALAWFKDEWHIILTRRSETVEIHSGQVSFPGGSCDHGESSPKATALREANEEIGLLPKRVRLLGRMNDMVTSTHFRVTPIVGVMPWPYPVRPAPGEVARVFTIPLLWLADRINWKEARYTPVGSRRTYPVVIYNTFDGEVLWGISGRIMVNLLELLGK